MKTVIIGAGAAGLGAGIWLREAGAEFEIIEGAHEPGGLAQTDSVDGFSFDRTGHFLHFRDPLVRDCFHRTGVRFDQLARRSAIVVGDKLVPYPFQYNLCPLGSPSVAQAAITELRQGSSADPSASFGQRLEAAWGPTCFDIFFRPYNEKLWGRSLDELPADCVGDYLPTVDVSLVERGASGLVFYPGYNAELTYPASGRLGDAMEAVARPLGDRINYGERVTAVDLPRHEIHTTAETTYGYDRLISTIPLQQLLDLSGFEAPKADLFAATEILNVRIGVRGTMKTQCQWVYVPDAGLPFHRIGFPHNVNPRTCPPDCASLSVEYTIPADGTRRSSSEVARVALEYAARLELVDVEECLTVSEYLVSPAYVVQRAPGRRDFADITAGLARQDIQLAGRFGTWDYLSVEEAFASGIEAASSATGSVRGGSASY